MATLSDTLLKKYQQRAEDAKVYEMLLKSWLEAWNTVEEWVQNDFIHESLTDLAARTRQELEYEHDVTPQTD